MGNLGCNDDCCKKQRPERLVAMAVGMCVIRINIARFFWKHLLASAWILKAIYYIDFSRMRGTTTDAGSNHYYFTVNFIPPPADAPYGTVILCDGIHADDAGVSLKPMRSFSIDPWCISEISSCTIGRRSVGHVKGTIHPHLGATISNFFEFIG